MLFKSLLKTLGKGASTKISVMKGNFVTKVFFSDNVESSYKNLLEMISPDVKANLKQKEIKELVVVSYKLL